MNCVSITLFVIHIADCSTFQGDESIQTAEWTRVWLTGCRTACFRPDGVLFRHHYDKSQSTDKLQERLSHCTAGTHWIRGRRDSSVGKVTRLRAGRTRTEVWISGRCKHFSVFKLPDCLWGLASLIFNGPRYLSLSLGVKQPARESNYSPSSSTENRNAWSYTATALCASLFCCLIWNRGNFVFAPVFTHTH